MNQIKTWIIILLCSISIGIWAKEYTIETVPNIQLTDARNFVSNPDSILSSASVSEIDQKLYEMRKINTAEVAVVAVSSIGNEDIDQFATELFTHWGIGKKEKDNGLLILFVEDQRKITFNTGYGLEGVLPDALCNRIQQQYMIPSFKTGNYSQGMVNGVNAIIKQLTDPEAIEEIYAQTKQEETDWSTILFYYLGASLIISFIFILIINSALKGSANKESYQKYRAIAPYRSTLLIFSILFPIFVLGLFFWITLKMKKLRDEKRLCKSCGQSLRKLNEQEDNKFLSPQENTEESINSVDYDVWLCDQCGNTEVYPYENAYTRYSVCPQCHSKAYSLERDRVLISPTPFSAGTGEKSYYCEHCKRRICKQYTIPMVIVAAGGGGRRGGGGGFGGGGFGGGRTGGGGSTSGW